MGGSLRISHYARVGLMMRRMPSKGKEESWRGVCVGVLRGMSGFGGGEGGAMGEKPVQLGCRGRSVERGVGSWVFGVHTLKGARSKKGAVRSSGVCSQLAGRAGAHIRKLVMERGAVPACGCWFKLMRHRGQSWWAGGCACKENWRWSEGQCLCSCWLGCKQSEMGRDAVIKTLAGQSRVQYAGGGGSVHTSEGMGNGGH